jgi:hypothetical protein
MLLTRRSCFPARSHFDARIGSEPARVLVYTPPATLGSSIKYLGVAHVDVAFHVRLEVAWLLGCTCGFEMLATM